MIARGRVDPNSLDAGLQIVFQADRRAGHGEERRRCGAEPGLSQISRNNRVIEGASAGSAGKLCSEATPDEKLLLSITSCAKPLNWNSWKSPLTEIAISSTAAPLSTL